MENWVKINRCRLGGSETHIPFCVGLMVSRLCTGLRVPCYQMVFL
jgi:hypothetical protein